MEIRPEHLRLTELLERRLFHIPEYQRSYSWSSRQRDDLFGDIDDVFKKGHNASHFMATIVCLRRDEKELGTSLFHVLDVVDGQQRLTTLIILLKAVQLVLSTSQSEEDRQISEDIEHLLVKRGDNSLLLLQTNHDSSHYFADFIRHGRSELPSTAITIADRELLSAIQECLQFVDDWQDEGRTHSDLVKLLKNKLSFVLYEISDEREVYTVFEVLNSRGIEVSWLDRLKSILMGAAFDLEDGDADQLVHDLHVIWRDIYSTIGLRQGLSTEALRFAATLLDTNGNKPLGEQASVDLLRQWTDTAEQIRDIADWLRRVTNACDSVLSDSRLDAVTRIAQARLLAVAIHLMENDEDDRDDLLCCWERVSFRIYGMFDKDARTGVGEYVRLSRLCIEEDATADAIRDGILEIGSWFPIGKAVDELRQRGNCYVRWQEKLRYMLYRYEEYLANEQGNQFRNEQWIKIWKDTAARSIEHVMPQSHAPDDVRHRLGNLIMLPPWLNSKPSGQTLQREEEGVHPNRPAGRSERRGEPALV